MPEHEDCENLKRQIKGVLRRYFEYDDHGNRNKEYDDILCAQDALDEIHEIVGEI